MNGLDDYEPIVGSEAVSSIYRRARQLCGLRLLEINSTYMGGGVAEMLNGFMRLMNDVGVDTDWTVLHGNPDFFGVTKKFHNALQGGDINLTEMKKHIYLLTNEEFSVYTHIHQDFVIVHDPQPLPLIKFYTRKQPWIWRCHVDLSEPNRALWKFLRSFVMRYDLVIVSNERYKQRDLPVEQRVIFPCIDPLSAKNKEIPDQLVENYLRKFGVDSHKPLVVQVSRFDPWKDPEGVIDVFKLVRKKVDCRLVLCGSFAPDDPEGLKVYERVKRKANDMIGRGDVVLLTTENSILVNALQRSASVIIQKSLREGFGLTVTEALWKEKPVVASNVGGIPVQISDGENGFLVQPHDTKGFAARTVKLLKDPHLGKELGKKGKQTVRRKFLITRLVSDYIDLLSQMRDGGLR